VRQIRRLLDNGRQVPFITTDPHKEMAEAAGAMFSRWSQENFLNLSNQCSFQSRSRPGRLKLAYVDDIEGCFVKFSGSSRNAAAALPCARAGLPWPGRRFSVAA